MTRFLPLISVLLVIIAFVIASIVKDNMDGRQAGAQAVTPEQHDTAFEEQLRGYLSVYRYVGDVVIDTDAANVFVGRGAVERRIIVRLSIVQSGIYSLPCQRDFAGLWLPQLAQMTYDYYQQYDPPGRSFSIGIYLYDDLIGAYSSADGKLTVWCRPASLPAGGK